MKLAILAAALLLAAPAAAQTSPEKTYTLTVTTADLAVVAQGLGEVPSKLANPVINKLNEQIKAQEAKPAETTKP